MPRLGIGLIAAHRRYLPPAKDEVFAVGDGEPVIAKIEIGVLDCQRSWQPGLDLLLLLCGKGKEQEVGFAGKVFWKVSALFVEAIGLD